MLLNDSDRFCCEWLRRLFPGGTVDARPIQELRADDLRGFGRVHLFAGIGGWEYALGLAGWPADREVWTGSCPCQPYSQAGKQLEGEDERNLWPEMLRLIAERRPATIFGEQVASPAGRRWLSGVRADLEALGYAVGAADLCAAGVSAPHIRQRLYWVADSAKLGRGQGSAQRHGGDSGGSEDVGAGPVYGGKADRMSDSEHAERRTINFDHEDGRYRTDGRREETHGEPGACSQVRRMADTDGGKPSDGNLQRGREHGQQQKDGGPIVRMGDSDKGRRGERADDADTNGRSFRNGFATAGPSAWDDYRIVNCADGKARRIGAGVQPLAHGVPGRVGRLRAYGNAIVAPLAAVFVRAFLDCEEN